jgi:peptidoglycan hydrolase CwlO-like protein
MMDELQEQLDSTQEQLDSANTTISTLSEKTTAQADEIARLRKLLEANNIKIE